MSFVSAIIVAAGNSTRMGTGRPKIFEDILGLPALVYTLKAFEDSELINEIIIVCKDEHSEKIKQLTEIFKISKFKKFATGGTTRQKSVFSGLSKISDESTHVAIHDAARLLVTKDIIDEVVKVAYIKGACATGVPVKDTIKFVDEDGNIINTVDRSHLWSVHTPQVFEKGLYLKAFEYARDNQKDYTDDCQLIENYGQKVQMILGSYSNLKLTTVDDIPIFEEILKRRNLK